MSHHLLSSMLEISKRTQIERSIPSIVANRDGVPQGKHTHVLLERGRHIKGTADIQEKLALAGKHSS